MRTWLKGALGVAAAIVAAVLISNSQVTRLGAFSLSSEICSPTPTMRIVFTF
jgi:hypothetical protein